MVVSTITVIVTTLIIVLIIVPIQARPSTPTEEPSTPSANTRNAKATPGDAEVIADTGYQHTVFDSAKENVNTVTMTSTILGLNQVIASLGQVLFSRVSFRM